MHIYYYYTFKNTIIQFCATLSCAALLCTTPLCTALLYTMRLCTVCEDRETNDNWKKNNFPLNINYLLHTLNSPLPIVTKQLSKILSYTERREVVFRTQWFIGQYCSEREGTGYRCRCTSFPFYDGLLWLHSTDDRKGDGFCFFQTITCAQVRIFFSIFTMLFLTFFLLLLYGLHGKKSMGTAVIAFCYSSFTV